MKTTAIIPGSFDPITVGHFSLVSRVAEAFDNVTVLVCHNFDKTYTFSPNERFEIAEKAFEKLPNVKVELYDGWLYEYLTAHKPCVLVKGVRDEKDFVYEKKMADFNFEKSGVETLFMISEPELCDTSSTAVRCLLEQKGDWKRLIPQNAQKIVEKFYAEK